MKSDKKITFETGEVIHDGHDVKVCHARLQDAPPEFADKQWIVKIIPEVIYRDSEAKILARYYPTFKPLKQHGHVYIVTEFLPGTSLQHYYSKRLNYVEILIAVNQLLLKLNAMHHTTLATGHAIAHGDIKIHNIRFTVADAPIESFATDLNKKMIKHITDVKFIDFGFSCEVSEDDPNFLQEQELAYHLHDYFPPEAQCGEFGIKTDIYLVADVISNILRLPKLPEIFPGIRDTISGFLTRMKAENHVERPNSDEVLKFFTTLRLLYEVYNATPKDKNTQSALYAKLILLERDMWDKNALSENKDTMWGQFDFENNNAICGLIASIKNHPLFDKALLKTLLQNQHFVKEMVTTDACTLLGKYAEIFPQREINKAISILAKKSGVAINLDVLCFIKGNVEQKRETALFAIHNALNHAKHPGEVTVIITKLKQLARDQKINFLYARQGLITFSIHNHKWDNEKVSGTWVSIMKAAEKKKADLEIKFDSPQQTAGNQCAK